MRFYLRNNKLQPNKIVKKNVVNFQPKNDI